MDIRFCNHALLLTYFLSNAVMLDFFPSLLHSRYQMLYPISSSSVNLYIIHCPYSRYIEYGFYLHILRFFQINLMFGVMVFFFGRYIHLEVYLFQML